jgi:hypothetical protein
MAAALATDLRQEGARVLLAGWDLEKTTVTPDDSSAAQEIAGAAPRARTS